MCALNGVKGMVVFMENKNWRSRIGKKRERNELDWRFYLKTEFVQFAEEVEKLSIFYNWNLWCGGVDNYSITLSQGIRNGLSISVRMIGGDKYKYYVSFAKEINPNNIGINEYKEFIGETMDDALKYIHTYLMEHEFERDYKNERFCFMGGAYDRYPIEKIWAYQELEAAQESEQNYISV